MKRFWIRRGLRFLGFAIGFGGLAGLAVMALWNALLPGIVGVSTINFVQALGLLILSRILFGSFGRGGWQGGYGPRGYGPLRRTGGGRAEWKKKMAERWQQMTPEQREQLKQQWRNTCGDSSRRRGTRNAPQPEPPAQDPPTPTAI